MKALPVIVICVVAAGLSLAQTTARPPHGLVTLDLSWSREISPPRAGGPPRDEISGPRRRDSPHDDPVDKLRAQPPVPGSRLPDQGELPYLYVYSLKVKNVGEKKVRGVFWEYVATDRDGGAELNRRQFISIQGIGPGEVASLRATSPSQPTNLVTPGGLGKDARSPFTSSAEIKCVLYADATVWGDGGGDKECAELRRADAQARGRKGKRP
jgi:hypothetical protein